MEFIEECPLGGDIENKCESCVYSVDYEYVDGECLKKIQAQ